MGWDGSTAEEVSESQFSNEHIYCDSVFLQLLLSEKLKKLSIAPLKHVSFDIECLPIDGSMPVPESSPVYHDKHVFQSCI